MDSKKLIAIAAVLILLIAGVAAVAMTGGEEGDEPNPEPVKKGFYAWDPAVAEINGTYCNITPAFMKNVEAIYEEVYGDVPSFDGITIDQIPAEYLYKYNKYWEYKDDKLIVKTFDNKSTSKLPAYADKEMKFVPTHVVPYMTTYVDTLYMIFCDKYNEPDHVGQSPQAEKALWELIPAIPSNMVKDLEGTYKIDVPDSVQILGTGIEDLIKYCETSTENTTILMSEYKIKDTNKSSWWKDCCAIEDKCPNVQFVYCLANSAAMVLSTIEMFGKIIDTPNTDSMMTSILAEIYVMQKAIDEKAETDGVKTFYLENASGKSIGNHGWLMGDTVTNVLKMQNIYDDETMQGNMSDENIIKAEPQVIIFYENDSRSMDERMRVPA